MCDSVGTRFALVSAAGVQRPTQFIRDESSLIEKVIPMGVSFWLQELADAVASRMLPIDLPAPVGCHVCEIDGIHELSVFPATTEVVGGKRDGRHLLPTFHLEVLPLLELFEEIKAIDWQNAPVNKSDELGAHVVIEAQYQGHEVRLQILARAPQRFEAGRQLHVHKNAIVETW